jgi:hypothetical protein
MEAAVCEEIAPVIAAPFNNLGMLTPRVDRLWERARRGRHLPSSLLDLDDGNLFVVSVCVVICGVLVHPFLLLQSFHDYLTLYTN